MILRGDGIPLLGYFHWSLLDNFEWVSGYSHQLGLHEVDFDTFARTPKPRCRGLRGSSWRGIARRSRDPSSSGRAFLRVCRRGANDTARSLESPTVIASRVVV